MAYSPRDCKELDRTARTHDALSDLLQTFYFCDSVDSHDSIENSFSQPF